MRKIEKFVKQNKIKFVDVVFLDLYGTTRQITIPTNKLADALDYGLKCDGSSVNYSNKIEDSDTRLILDETSYFLLPDNKLMVFCFTDNTYDARKNLFNLQTDLSQNNTKINFGAELEFFLFKQANGQVDLNNSDNLKYFNQITGDYSNCLNDICNFCADKINLEALHHECGRNQFEIDWKYDTPLKTADNVVFLKRVIRFFAEKYGFRACFMPKPLNGVSGSGMHLNISIFKGEQNLFYDKNDTNNLSEFAYKFVKNIFNHISAITAFANPLVNSYKRLNTGFETPTQVNYSSTNRSALVRIPKASPKQIPHTIAFNNHSIQNPPIQNIIFILQLNPLYLYQIF